MTTDPVTAKPDLYTALLEQAAYLRAHQESKPPPADPRPAVDPENAKPPPTSSFALTLAARTQSDSRQLANASRQTDDYTKLVAQNRAHGSTGLTASAPTSEPVEATKPPPDEEATAAHATESPRSTFLEVQTILVGEEDPTQTSRHPFVRFAARLYQNINRYRPTAIDPIGSTLNAIA